MTHKIKPYIRLHSSIAHTINCTSYMINRLQIIHIMLCKYNVDNYYNIIILYLVTLYHNSIRIKFVYIFHY